MHAERVAVKGASQLLRARVCTGSGEIIGRVDDILFNPATGKLEYLSVRPRIESGSMCVRLAWKQVRVDNLTGRIVVVPGATAAKRLLIRAGLSNRRDAIH